MKGAGTIATGTITGHEAAGSVQITRAEDGGLTAHLERFEVAPGAPDVRLYISPRSDGTFDDDAIELGTVPDHETELTFPIPRSVAIDQMRSILVYCKVYSVPFGAGRLTFQDREGSDDG